MDALNKGVGHARIWTATYQLLATHVVELVDEGIEATDLISYMDVRAKPWAQIWQRDTAVGGALG